LEKVFPFSTGFQRDAYRQLSMRNEPKNIEDAYHIIVEEARRTTLEFVKAARS